MVDPNSIPKSGPGAIRPADLTPARGDSAAGKATSGPAFQALLEKLQLQAQELQRESENVVEPDQLTEAVDRAHDSLKDALSLGDKLLEAYRESRIGTPEAKPDSAA